jgi:uncharacterized cupin superfamily protein
VQDGGMFPRRIIHFDRNVPLSRWPDYPEEEIAEGSRACNGHFYLEDPKLGLTAGVWEAEANATHWIDYPVHEFMILLEGHVTILEEGHSTTIRAGESFVIPKGLRCRWMQKGRVRKFFLIVEDNSEFTVDPRRRMIKIDPKAALASSDPPSPAVLLSPPPTQHSHDAYVGMDGRFTVGVWDTTAYTRKLIDFPRHELMHLLEGSVTFTDAAGEKQTFKAGDTLFVPMGTPNAWSCSAYLRKIYCILMPPKP